MTSKNPDLVSIRLELDEAAREATSSRSEMTAALLHLIDATMPATADIVNYRLPEGGGHLVLEDASSEHGEELDLADFSHIADV